jgi:hypothetical protein
MSIANKKPQLDLVMSLPGATGQEIEQKDRHNDAVKIYSCFKEFEAADFETRNPKMKFSIQPSPYSISSGTSTLSGKICKVKESGLTFLQPAEPGYLNFNQLSESYSVVTGIASELCSFPEAPKNRN